MKECPWNTIKVIEISLLKEVFLLYEQRQKKRKNTNGLSISHFIRTSMNNIGDTQNCYLNIIMGSDPKMEFNCKEVCIYSYMFKLPSPSKYSPLMQYTYQEVVSTAQKFLNLSILIHFCVSAVFCFTSSTSAKYFPLKTFFIQGN